MEDTETWYIEDPHLAELDMRDREWNSLKSTIGLHGYREGMGEGTDTAKQEGFDDWVSIGANTGFGWGYLAGVLSTLNSFSQGIGKEQIADQLRTRIDTMHTEIVEKSQEYMEGTPDHSSNFPLDYDPLYEQVVKICIETQIDDVPSYSSHTKFSEDRES
eukprot:TRINITY_DN3430_c0_g2_i2.p2 TRINITY_DN3430_c0_g2~~TRINITY_DN3430_c0_g2_i2.p2  ORF type:complete len:160 (+),score=44.45 TRINITY_DN3430_c0_g2_i2:37-516(+)